MFSVVTPKWREPTKVIRMVVLSVLRRGLLSVDNTPEASVTPPAGAAAGYQQGGVNPWRGHQRPMGRRRKRVSRVFSDEQMAQGDPHERTNVSLVIYDMTAATEAPSLAVRFLPAC
jgi:hypothetical protein